MRTTLVIEDDLIASARRHAAETGRSLSAVVGDALRALLDERGPSHGAAAFRLPVFDGHGRAPVDTRPSEFLALAEEADLGGFGR